jgi:ribosome biogenesis GTPase / thiamine phosphate phosphatase
MAELITGRILKSIRGHFWVEAPSGTYHCLGRGGRRGARNNAAITVGDLVQIEAVPGELMEGVIVGVLPRRTKLSRRIQSGPQDIDGREDVVAANIDHVVVVASAHDPPLRPGLIDRYLVAAGKGGLDPIICINKIDLADPQEIEPVVDMYKRLSYPVILACAKSGRGIDELGQRLRDAISVLAGHSGVGKSTLLKQLCPGLDVRTGEVNRKSGRGKHTTTTAQLIQLPAGGYVIDTPGIRQFGLWDPTPEDVRTYFVEISRYSQECRFRDCSHVVEPDCAVREGLDRGLIHPMRYESFLRLQEECRTTGHGGSTRNV